MCVCVYMCVKVIYYVWNGLCDHGGWQALRSTVGMLETQGSDGVVPDQRLSGWDPGKVTVSVWVWRQAINSLSSSGHQAGGNFLLLSGMSAFLLCSPSKVWMRPTSTGKGSLLYSACSTDANLVQKPLTGKARIMFNQIAWAPFGLVKLTHKISHYSR